MKTKSALVRQQLRYQQWIAEVQEYNARPAGMSMNKWCKGKGIPLATFSDHLHTVQELCLEQTDICLPGTP